jgi:hypothetical protein
MTHIAKAGSPESAWFYFAKAIQSTGLQVTHSIGADWCLKKENGYESPRFA